MTVLIFMNSIPHGFPLFSVRILSLRKIVQEAIEFFLRLYDMARHELQRVPEYEASVFLINSNGLT